MKFNGEKFNVPQLCFRDSKSFEQHVQNEKPIAQIFLFLVLVLKKAAKVLQRYFKKQFAMKIFVCFVKKEWWKLPPDILAACKLKHLGLRVDNS